MRTKYIFDTSVLIDNPSAYKQFPHCDVIIPIAVINELDDLKKQFGEVGRHARVCIKSLDNLSNTGDISTGILLDNDALLKIDATYYNPSDAMFAGFGSPSYGDTQILACLYANWSEHDQRDVILVSNDFNLRIKAKARGIEAISHEESGSSVSDMYSGIQTVNDLDLATELEDCKNVDPLQYNLQLHPHECVFLPEQEIMARMFSGSLNLLKKKYPWGISGRNKEQDFAIDLIMDKNVDLITLTGTAGTGKTLVALASALELVISKKVYDKLIIYRPIQAVGNDIGYIPGTIQEKLSPWFQAIMDTLENLLSSKNGDHWKRSLEMFQKKGLIEMEAITYIRGRSISNAIMFIDEVQNLSKEEVKTILTRAGEGTKIVMTGDLEQIDNSILDATNNGLTYVIEKFKNSELAGHITFTRGERSRLASKAAEIL